LFSPAFPGCGTFLIGRGPRSNPARAVPS
jgi:hypothetical protein